MKKRRKRKASRRKTIKRSERITMISITLVVCLIFVALLLESRGLRDKIADTKAKQESLMAEIEEEKQRTKDIKKYEEYMKSDDYIEKVAREKAGLVKSNEKVFKVQK